MNIRDFANRCFLLMTVQVLILLIFPILQLSAQVMDNGSGQAPFGLGWGMSTENVMAQNIKLDDLTNNKEFGATYQASNLQKTLLDARLVGLSFGYNNKLWRVIVFGEKIENDPYGAKVKERYTQLAAALSDKYGKGNHQEYQDTEIWKNADEFVMGINVGRSWYYTNYETPNISVQLGIQADGNSSSWWRIIYESKALRSRFEADQQAHEKDAL